jgi:predicted site-specific integrase-resolvase
MRKPEIQQRLTTVIYARVSSKEQEKEGFSIPAQLKLLHQYATDHGFPVLQEYIDVETAKRAGRTGFTEMVGFFKMKRTPSSRQKRAIIKIDCYRFELKYIAAGVRYPNA